MVVIVDHAGMCLRNAPPPLRTPIGFALAKAFVEDMVNTHGFKEKYEVMGVLRIWNAQGGNPFTPSELEEFANIKPATRDERTKKRITNDQPALFQ